MTIIRGYSAVNRIIKSQHRGLSGVNRIVKEHWRGLSGVNRKVFSSWNRELYNAGNEYTDVTGGWNTMSYRATYTSVHTVTEEASYIKITCKGASSSTGQTLYTHEIPIDLTGYTTLHAISYVKYSNDKFSICVDNVKNSGAMSGSYTSYMVAYGETSSATTPTELTLDISAISGLHYVYILCSENYSGGNVETNAYFSKVWLT